MSEVNSLVQRIRGEFAASEAKIKQFQNEQMELHHGRVQRLERLEEIFEQLREVWRPRLEALAREFGDQVEASPVVMPGRRQATMTFKSPLARIVLNIAASSNADVTQFILTFDLEILPILMQFERHAELAFPLEQVAPEAVGKWLDDRLVAFVKTYLSLHENEYYLKDHMVSDPIAQVRFPKYAAGATRQRQGKTFYFLSEETAVEFDRQQA